MKVIWVVCLWSLISFAAFAEEVQVEIHLPQLLGLYETYFHIYETKVDTFSVPPEVASISRLEIHYTGVGQYGTLYCLNEDEFKEWSINIMSGIWNHEENVKWNSDSNFWSMSPPSKSSFFFPMLTDPDSTDLNFLLEGEHEIKLTAGGGGYNPECPPFNDYQTIEFSEVKLVVFGETLVSVERSSWGGVKALYR